MTIKLFDLIGADPARPFSPHCWKTMMSLAHKRLDYEREGVPFTEVPTIEGGVSPIVPVIRDGSRVVSDSFLIADYLEESYPDRPTLFAGEGGMAAARFVEGWSQSALHPALGVIAMLEIHDCLATADREYFRSSREARMGKTLEQVTEGRAAEIAGFATKLQPLRHMLKSQMWIGGASPLFADYIVFGALQWARITSTAKLLDPADPVADWFERCLDLHGGLGRSVPAAS